MCFLIGARIKREGLMRSLLQSPANTARGRLVIGRESGTSMVLDWQEGWAFWAEGVATSGCGGGRRLGE